MFRFKHDFKMESLLHCTIPISDFNILLSSYADLVVKVGVNIQLDKFADLSEDQRVQAMWDAIFQMNRVTEGGDAVI